MIGHTRIRIDTVEHHPLTEAEMGWTNSKAVRGGGFTYEKGVTEPVKYCSLRVEVIYWMKHFVTVQFQSSESPLVRDVK